MKRLSSSEFRLTDTRDEGWKGWRNGGDLCIRCLRRERQFESMPLE